MKTLSLFVAASALLLLSGCASTTSTPTTTSGGTSGGTSGPAAVLYTTNVAGSSSGIQGQILSFPTTASGTATPAATLNDTNNNSFGYLAADSNGNIYAFTSAIYSGTGASIQAYSHNAAGVLTLSRSFTCSCLTGQEPITVDKSGIVYVDGFNKTYAFSSTASGTVSPTLTLSGYSGWMATDASGNLYIQNYSSASIYVFNAGFTGSSAPSRTITSSALTAQNNPIAVDLTGNLYVLTRSSASIPEVLVFAPTANGASTPTRIISGSATKMVQPSDIAVDAAGNIYVADIAMAAPSLQFYLEFSPTATGNVAPTASFSAAGATYGYEAIAVY